MKTVISDEVAAFEGTLIDVRLEDDFDAGHLPGAVSNCVFEVAFGERMISIAENDVPIVVYGAAESSAEAAMAAEKLARMGYTDVRVFAGGIAAWKDAGRDLAGDGIPPKSASAADGRYEIDLADSRVLWVGRNLLNRHWGTVAISGGWIEVTDGELSGAEITVDMRCIECSDLDENSGRDMLIGHLQNDDFFDVENHPEAQFRLGNAQRIEGAAAGSPNLHLEGEMMVKGVIAGLAFDAAAGFTDEDKPAAQATLVFDRTLWDVIYGSGKRFHRLAGHLVNDLIELQVKVVAK